MKNILILFSIIISGNLAMAQSKILAVPEKANTASVLSKDTVMIHAYRKALDYADFEAAKNIVFMQMAKDTGTAWLDSLVQLYFSLGAYSQCVLAGNDYLSRNANNALILEIVAASDYSLKRYKEALEEYERLFKTSQSPYHAYQIAVNQYMLKRLGECEATIQFVLADKNSESQKVVINSSNGGSQQVPLRAAAWNLRGVLYRDQSKNNEAQQCFSEAIKLFPDFVLAKGNLNALQNPEKAVAKPASKPAGTGVKK